VHAEGPALEGFDHAGSRAGRYEIRERIGAGAMGVVYEAFDPQLHRKLAVKFVVPQRDTPRARDRLLREAQALARVKHPNVVSVYDAGESGGQVFIAMDFVAGVTLAKWLTRAHTWREVVPMFVQAGRGLAAAHAAGLVHRDFKPDNVLVDEHGIARVADFGLVRPLDESTQGEHADVTPPETSTSTGIDTATGHGTLVDDSLTQAGTIVGTPAYMAPEQAHGGVADPRSDQFSFCVALFEGLHGRRPHDGGSTLEQAGSRERGQSRRGDIPPRIHAAIRRGLSIDPRDRWPSMNALLSELERTRVHVSWRSMAAVATTVIALVLAAVNFDALRAWCWPVTLTFSIDEAQLVEPMRLYTSPGGEPYAASTVANMGRVELDVELPNAGRYYLHGLAWEPQLGGERGDADSFFVYVDDGEEKLWHFGCENEVMPEHVLIDNWAWQPVLHMANADSDCVLDPESSWQLDAGRHRIVFRNRENAANPETAARLARVVLTNQSGWRP
jgi:tRNA A-37 threonylcarbamoyl transferase component Bud32